MVALGSITGWQPRRRFGYDLDGLTRGTRSGSECAAKRSTTELPEDSAPPDSPRIQGEGHAATTPDGRGVGHTRRV